jgi:hypothetical protein
MGLELFAGLILGLETRMWRRNAGQRLPAIDKQHRPLHEPSHGICWMIVSAGFSGLWDWVVLYLHGLPSIRLLLDGG